MSEVEDLAGRILALTQAELVELNRRLQEGGLGGEEGAGVPVRPSPRAPGGAVILDREDSADGEVEPEEEAHDVR